MGASLFDRWAERLAQEGIVRREDVALYSYGLWQGLLLLLNIGTALLIGLLLDEVVACIIFLVCYLPLRSMAGGYHARTPLRCYLLGIVLVTTALAAIKWLPWTLEGALSTAAIASVIIWRLSPVEDENKPLDEKELVHFRKKMKKIVVAEYVVIVADKMIRYIQLNEIVTTSMICVCCLQLWKVISIKE